MYLYQIIGVFLLGAYAFGAYAIVLGITSYQKLPIMGRPKKWRLWLGLVQATPVLAFYAAALLPDLFARPGTLLGSTLYVLAVYTILDGVYSLGKHVHERWKRVVDASKGKYVRPHNGCAYQYGVLLDLLQIAFAVATIALIF